MNSKYPIPSLRTADNLLINLPRAKTKFQPFSIFKIEASSLFTQYQHKASKIKIVKPATRNRFISPQRNSKDDLLYSKEKEEISRILSQSKPKRPFASYDKEFKIKVNEASTEYQDPLESFSVLKHNQQIHNSIAKQNQARELQSFSKIITDIQIMKKLRKSNGNIRIRAINLNKLRVNFNKNPLPRMSSCNVVTLNANHKVRLKGVHLYPNKNFPESRQQFTLVSDTIGDSQCCKYIYLFGGISSNKEMNSLWRLDACKLTWECIKAHNIQSLPRYGHTCVYYKNKLILFGGKMINEPSLAGLDVYAIDNNEWYTPVLPPLNYIRPRYGHIACVIGQHMLVHGGINEFDQLINETYVLQLSPSNTGTTSTSQVKWLKCQIDTYLCQSPFRTMHSCCLVLPTEFLSNPKLNIYTKEIDVDMEIINKHTKEIGLYVFGGKDRGEPGCSNDMFVLHICSPKLDWVKITTKGLGPSPRYLTAMTYHSLGNLIFIHGGRSDNNGSVNELSDLYALELSKFDWIKIVISNISLDKRCGHACFIQDDYYFIFGGMNNQTYLKSSFLVINLVDEEQNSDLKHIKPKQSSHQNSVIEQGSNSPRKKLKQLRFFAPNEDS